METSVLVSESALPPRHSTHTRNIPSGPYQPRSVRSSGQVAACSPRSCVDGGTMPETCAPAARRPLNVSLLAGSGGAPRVLRPFGIECVPS